VSVVLFVQAAATATAAVVQYCSASNEEHKAVKQNLCKVAHVLPRQLVVDPQPP
jgi:hypothetical protein